MRIVAAVAKKSSTDSRYPHPAGSKVLINAVTGQVPYHYLTCPVRRLTRTWQTASKCLASPLSNVAPNGFHLEVARISTVNSGPGCTPSLPDLNEAGPGPIARWKRCRWDRVQEKRRLP